MQQQSTAERPKVGARQVMRSRRECQEWPGICPVAQRLTERLHRIHAREQARRLPPLA
jgi:hypothetical protein